MLTQHLSIAEVSELVHSIGIKLCSILHMCVCVCTCLWRKFVFLGGLNPTTEDVPIKHYIAWLDFTCGIQATY